MGREIQTDTTFRGVTARAKVLLESEELILRGGHKARLARASLDQVTAEADGLHLMASGEPLLVTMSLAEAQRWAAAISKPLPSLADKLGLSAERRVRVIGAISDPALCAAAAGFIAEEPSDAAILLTELTALDQLEVASQAALTTGLPLWCAYPKGKGAVPSDSDVRLALRGAGLIDTKSCSVSQQLTATRYSLAKAPGKKAEGHQNA